MPAWSSPRRIGLRSPDPEKCLHDLRFVPHHEGDVGQAAGRVPDLRKGRVAPSSVYSYLAMIRAQSGKRGLMGSRETSPTLGAIARAPFLALLLSLLTLLFLSPFSGMGSLVRAGIGIAATAVVFSTLRLVAIRRQWLVIAILSGLSGSLLKVVSEFWQMEQLYVASESLLLFFFLLLSAMILNHVVRSPRVSMDSVLGAACVYLLMGFIWAKLFILAEWLQPGSFNLPPLDSGDGGSAYLAIAASGHLTYLSFITLTTVGYGDLSPIKPGAQMLAMVEGLAGQLYVAIMLARMVALQVAQNITGRTGS